jgi:hypothetical protein
MKYRKLRITWSVAWGLLAVLLCVLWVRSATHGDFLLVLGHQITSMGGTIRFDENFVYRGPVESAPQIHSMWDSRLMWTTVEPQFVQEFATGTRVRHPYLIAGAFTLAGMVWLPSRFRLRTLLIATTLVAVVLGLIVWIARS